jgi:hypothetical protein
MATLESRLNALAAAIGADVKTLTARQGDLTALTTTAKSNLVAALNELKALVGSSGASINDSATASTTEAWSAKKIGDTLAASISALRDELSGGAGAALDTFAELAAALGNDPSFAATIATALGSRVRFDAEQTLTLAQKAQARANIDAYGSEEIGDPDADLVAAYATAKA